MKQKFLQFSVGILVLSMVSCSASRQVAQQRKAAPHPTHASNLGSPETAAPQFMDEVTIHPGSNAVSLRQQKNVYGKPAPAATTSRHRRNKEAKTTGQSDHPAHNPLLNAFIDEWYGVPYRLGGTTKKGIDCSAFVQELYERVYKTSLLRTAFQQFSASIPIFDKDELKEGDLVFFKIHSSRISHVGVYLSDGKFVHASSHGVMISDLSSNYWTRYYVGGGRISS